MPCINDGSTYWIREEWLVLKASDKDPSSWTSHVRSLARFLREKQENLVFGGYEYLDGSYSNIM